MHVHYANGYFLFCRDMPATKFYACLSKLVLYMNNVTASEFHYSVLLLKEVTEVIICMLIIEVPFCITSITWFCNRSDGSRSDIFLQFFSVVLLQIVTFVSRHLHYVFATFLRFIYIF